MLDFVDTLERLVVEESECTQWELSKIARYCNLPCHKVFEHLTSALNEEINAREPLSRGCLLQTLVILKEKIRPQLLIKQKMQLRQQKEAIKLYHKTMDKVRDSQRKGDWHKAYRSLSYFANGHDQHLSHEIHMVLYNDCLHLGIKAGTNLQELGNWLSKVVEKTLLNPSNETLTDAFDFIETYKDSFFNDKSGHGSKLLRSIATPLQERASLNNMPLPSLLKSA